MTSTREYTLSLAERLGWPTIRLSLRQETVGGDERSWRRFAERANDADVLDAAAELESLAAKAERGSR